MKLRALAAVLGTVMIAGCGGATGDAGLGDGDGDGDAADDGDGDQGPGTGTGDDGGDDGSDGAGFQVTGTVAQAAGLRAGRAARPAPDEQRIIDHVIAVSPSSQGERRYSAVAADGSFALDIDLAHAWVLVFVDSTRIGADMIAGVLGAGTLDTLTPIASGGVDLGEVATSDAGESTPGLSYDELLAALGIAPEAADYLGALDDVCLRYVNPDIDGDGELDVLQSDDHRFLLDFHVLRTMAEDGDSATVADLVGRFLDPAITTATFDGTGVYVSVPAAFWSGTRAEASMIFDGELAYYAGGGGGVVTAGAGTPVTGDDLIDNDYGEMRGVGVYAAPGHDLPQGVYQAELGERSLSFTGVATLSDEELASAEGTLLPFVRFSPVEEACTSACAIASIDVEWRKRTAEGWVAATAAELALTVGEGGGFASIVVGAEGGAQHIGVTLPAAEPSASVPWLAANAHLDGIDAAAFAAVTTDQVCHFGLSYDDKLGMRHFAGIGDAEGTCAP